MPRTKRILAFIEDYSRRRASYKKRNQGLVKKAKEISVLCGVDVCLLVYSPFDKEPVVWPPAPNEVQRVLSRFRSLPETEKNKRMLDVEGFVRQSIAKVQGQYRRLQLANRQKEVTVLMYECLAGKSLEDLSVLDLYDMTSVIEQTIRKIKEKLESLLTLQLLLPAPTDQGKGKEVMVSPEMPDQSNMQDPPSYLSLLMSDHEIDYTAFGWDATLFPPEFNNDGAEPSFTHP